MKIGFVGLGLMGNPMAKNIFKKGFNLCVYNRNPAKSREFKKMGVEVFDNPKNIAENCDIVITMVTGPKDVSSVLFGKDGVVAGVKKNLVVIDMSTIGPKSAKEIGDKLQEKGIDFLDSPVTGSVIKAKSGELTIFIGGKEEVFKKVKKVLEAMGTNLQYMGESGMGQAIKMINNSIIAAQLTALAEGMIMADKMGLSRQKVVNALENTPLASAMMKLKMPNMVENKFPTAFSMKNHHKDLVLARQEAKDLPLLRLLEKLYKKSFKMGFSEKDNSAILRVLENSLN